MILLREGEESEIFSVCSIVLASSYFYVSRSMWLSNSRASSSCVFDSRDALGGGVSFVLEKKRGSR